MKDLPQTLKTILKIGMVKALEYCLQALIV